MPTRFTPLEHGSGGVPGLPEPADLADLWLGHALSCLFDACEVPLADRRRLVEAGGSGPGPGPGLERDDADSRRARLDSCRLAVLFGALAVEARLDRLLRCGDATDWPAVAHLPPAERFSIARRLLDGFESAPEDAGLARLAVELFALRGELVDAVGRPGAAMVELAPEFSPSRTDAMVGASARLCDFLASLAGEGESATAPIVEHVAAALVRRASDLSPAAAGPPRPVEAWTADVEFPPDLVGS